MMTAMVIDPQQLQHMDAQQLRALAEGLMAKLVDKDQEIHFKQTKIDLLTHEIARYKRLQFAAKSEKLHADQRSLLDEALEGCPSTTTGSRTRSGPLRLVARTGCLRARCWQASAQPPS